MRYAAKNPFSYVHANIGGQVALFETIKVRLCELSAQGTLAVFQCARILVRTPDKMRTMIDRGWPC